MVIPHDLVGWFPPPFLLSLNHKIPNVIVPTFYYLAFSDLVLSTRFGTLGFLTCGFLICGITEAFFKGNHTLNHDLLISLRWGGRESSLRHSLCWGPPETYWNPQRSVWRPLAWSSPLMTKMVNIYEAYTMPIRYKQIDKCHSFDFLTVLWS